MVVEERRMTHVGLGRVKIFQAAFRRIVRKEVYCSNQLPAVFAYEEGDSAIRTRLEGHCVEQRLRGKMQVRERVREDYERYARKPPAN